MARTSCEICGTEVDDEELDPCGHFTTDDEEGCPVPGCNAPLVEFGTVSGGSEQATRGDLDCACCAQGHNLFSRNGSPWSLDD
jgi:hypothetical protein